MKRSGRLSGGKRKPPAWLDAAKKAKAEGLSYQEVAERVGATRQQTYYWLTRKDRGRTSKECPVCGDEFSPYDLGQKYCSRKCFFAREIPKEQRDRQAAAMRKRKGSKNPNFKGGSRVGVRNREGERRWYADQEPRCRHPDCSGGGLLEVIVLHHVVYRQHLGGGDEWDPANSLSLCNSCHSSHHQRGQHVVPLSVLRDENYTFAFELLGPAAYDYLRRYYDGEDPRLDALLQEEAA